MERAALEQVQQLIEDDIKARFPGGGVERVVILQYGDDPVVEPGEVAVRVFVAAEGEPEDRERVVDDFGRAFRRELEQLRGDLSQKLPEARRLEFYFGDDMAAPGIKMDWGPREIDELKEQF